MERWIKDTRRWRNKLIVGVFSFILRSFSKQDTLILWQLFWPEIINTCVTNQQRGGGQIKMIENTLKRLLWSGSSFVFNSARNNDIHERIQCKASALRGAKRHRHCFTDLKLQSAAHPPPRAASWCAWKRAVEAYWRSCGSDASVSYNVWRWQIRLLFFPPLSSLSVVFPPNETSKHRITRSPFQPVPRRVPDSQLLHKQTETGCMY